MLQTTAHEQGEPAQAGRPCAPGPSGCISWGALLSSGCHSLSSGAMWASGPVGWLETAGSSTPPMVLQLSRKRATSPANPRMRWRCCSGACRECRDPQHCCVAAATSEQSSASVARSVLHLLACAPAARGPGQPRPVAASRRSTSWQSTSGDCRRRHRGDMLSARRARELKRACI